MAFLVDNDILSQLNRTTPIREVVDWFESLQPDEFYLAQITIFEQFRGIELVKQKSTVVAETLRLWWEPFLETVRPENIVASNVEALRIQAQLYAEPKLRNFHLPHPIQPGKSGVGEPDRPKVKTGGDLILAATSIASGIPIATLNVADFMEIQDCVNLPGLYDPKADKWFVKPTSQSSAKPRPVDVETFAKSLGKLSWNYPYSKIISEGQSEIFREMIAVMSAESGLSQNPETTRLLLASPDRAALKRFARRVSRALDLAAAEGLMTAMDEASVELEEPKPESNGPTF
ncbi:hypothetical protein [Methylobacterium sp. V23]|uniref:type II toxin-antitoxin system VapC family toxin n=1 Tax=Methylobacterium sp. V23 TaxID=2044878 RepID=UPI000CDBA4F8|nr:hypothetical protein [Methylobacterium sp. V23]POR39946.1 hypothetical protein CRT23_26600 [Methylobacterium sp. V23]